MRGWSVVVPLKRLARAKSRLRGVVPLACHERLVSAMVADTVTAALATDMVDRVLVVTDEPEPPTGLDQLGAVWVPDAQDAGLNAALEDGEGTARRRWPAAGVAALTGDLPALSTTDLGAALRAAAEFPRAFVADAEGEGTTLLAVSPAARLAPRFGPTSATAHAESGAAPLIGRWPTLRRDVDTAADLTVAHRYGLGPRTAALLADHGIVRLRA